MNSVEEAETAAQRACSRMMSLVRDRSSKSSEQSLLVESSSSEKLPVGTKIVVGKSLNISEENRRVQSVQIAANPLLALINKFMAEGGVKQDAKAPLEPHCHHERSDLRMNRFRLQRDIVPWMFSKKVHSDLQKLVNRNELKFLNLRIRIGKLQISTPWTFVYYVPHTIGYCVEKRWG